ncbi:hypothetical protein GMRT_10748 [Giardia muris]|uniref:EGF-like domain-containing protein n=1 Tax=Giardia muris TaxID=5742 RepID=A0A4Z1SY87_GIAMU|nr:hypothetical protein GMRT_10748 [Giardia muris]|eukprot:TNJ30664.1 hypothetical protein GMRT_10748 [Giardia muris]
MQQVLLALLFIFVFGEADSSFVIINDQDGLRRISENPTGFFRLGADINLAGTWTPIPNNFSGVIDGNGYSIRNIALASSVENSIGFFTSLYRAQLYDITFEFNTDLILSDDTSVTRRVGGIAGIAIESTFYLVKVTGSLSVTHTGTTNAGASAFPSLDVGGALGDYNCKDVSGSGIYSDVELSVRAVSGSMHRHIDVGGIAGYITGFHGFTDLFPGTKSTVTVTADTVNGSLAVGGAFGYLYSLAYYHYGVGSSKSVKASITKGNAYVGGLVGLGSVLQRLDSAVEAVECTAHESASCYVGGVVGGLKGVSTKSMPSTDLRTPNESTMIRCKGLGNCSAGGVIGTLELNDISRCVSYAGVYGHGTGYVSLGGIVGYLRGSRVFDSYSYAHRIDGNQEEGTNGAQVKGMRIGGLIGTLMHHPDDPYTLISNNYVDVTSFNAVPYGWIGVGGLIGYAFSESNDVRDVGGEVYDCAVKLGNITITANSTAADISVSRIYAGGIVGSGFALSIHDSYVTYDTINVTGHSDQVLAGGIAGTLSLGGVAQSFAVGKTLIVKTNRINDTIGTVVTAAGGIAGKLSSSFIRSTYTTTDTLEVSGNSKNSSSVGGLVGLFDGSSSSVSLSYSVTKSLILSVTNSTLGAVGGLIGLSPEGDSAPYGIVKSWASANISILSWTPVGSDTLAAGGFIGQVANNMTMRNCYVEGQINNSVGSTTSTSMNIGTFTGVFNNTLRVDHSISTVTYISTSDKPKIKWYGKELTGTTSSVPFKACLYATSSGVEYSDSDTYYGTIEKTGTTPRNCAIQGYTLDSLKSDATYQNTTLGKDSFYNFTGGIWAKEASKLPHLTAVPYLLSRDDASSKAYEVTYDKSCTKADCWFVASGTDPNKKFTSDWKTLSDFEGRLALKKTLTPCGPNTLCKATMPTPGNLVCGDSAQGDRCNECKNGDFCSGHGTCRHGKCVCNPGFGGPDCSVAYCRTSAEGLCGGGASICTPIVGVYTCSCGHGFFKYENVCIRSPAALSLEPIGDSIDNNGGVTYAKNVSKTNLALVIVFSILLIASVAAIATFTTLMCCNKQPSKGKSGSVMKRGYSSYVSISQTSRAGSNERISLLDAI